MGDVSGTYIFSKTENFEFADFDGKNACPIVFEGRGSESDLGFDF
jgi:hypothetical protein